jgi:flagellar motor switch protein FliG
MPNPRRKKIDDASDMRQLLTGKRKAAMLLIALGEEVSTKVLKKLKEPQIEAVTQEIAEIGFVDSNEKKIIFDEFKSAVQEHGILSEGGLTYLRSILEKAIGPHKASLLLDRIIANKESIPFDCIRDVDPAQILNFIQNEHPQTIALIISYMRPEQAADILSQLPHDKQVEVINRVVTMDQTAPDVIKEIEFMLQKKIASVSSQEFSMAGGVKSVAEVLNRADRATEKSIIEALEEENPEIADEVKKLMFVFEDIIMIDERGIQTVLKEVDNKELALALKTASEELREKIFANMSKRAAEGIREEMEYMGPVRLKNVEEAQQNIVAIVRRLEDSGEIIIGGRGGGEDELIV